ncbi:uncharacterized protein LOC143984389 [Lithobates pipiens]
MPGKREMKILSDLLSAVITTFTMRAACLVVLVLLVVETSCQNGLFSHIPVGTKCCEPKIKKDLQWKNIISYSYASEQCSQKAVFVTLKNEKKPCCFDAKKKSTLWAIGMFEQSKKQKKN